MKLHKMVLYPLVVTSLLTQTQLANSNEQKHQTKVSQIKVVRPVPAKLHVNRSIDPTNTGTAGTDRTRLIWEKMIKEQEDCGYCALRQPFPGDADQVILKNE